MQLLALKTLTNNRYFDIIMIVKNRAGESPEGVIYMMKNEVQKSTNPEDPWGVLELFEDLMNEADEIVNKYKKVENKNA